MLDLLAPETAQALRRVGARAQRPAHHAAWALEAFDGDEELAAAALMDEHRVSWAAAGVAHARDPRWRASWEGVHADRARLLALQPAQPRMPREITRWVCERLGLDVDASELAARARKVGTRASVTFVIGLPELSPVEVADRLAIAVGGYPIGAGWTPVADEQGEADLAYAIGHDLAYGIERRNPASSRARARRFLAAAPGATVLTNSSLLGTGARVSTPVTFATFDWAIAVAGPTRAGIAIFTGED